MLAGPAEVDETYVGLQAEKYEQRQAQRACRGRRGTVGKAAVAGVKDRETSRVAARRMEATDATLYTDEAKAYAGMPESAHEAVNHSAKEFVRGIASTNSMESFRAMLKRDCQGTCHKFSDKHLDRCVGEFAGRHKIHEADNEDQMAIVARQTVGHRLRYADLIADNGLPSEACG